MFVKSIIKNLWNTIKKKLWYIFVLFLSSAYVFHYRLEIYELKEINARNLIFLLWLVLLIFPLFSELEFLGVKVKKEVAEATGEIKESVQQLHTQIAQLQVSSSFAANFSISGGTLPSEEKMDELLKLVQELNAKAGEDNLHSFKEEFIEDKNVYLFKIRLQIEKSVRELISRLDIPGPTPLSRQLYTLLRTEIISDNTFELAMQILKIANRGVHGEIVSDEYISFVQKTYPELMKQLNEALRHGTAFYEQIV